MFSFRVGSEMIKSEPPFRVVLISGVQTVCLPLRGRDTDVWIEKILKIEKGIESKERRN